MRMNTPQPDWLHKPTLEWVLECERNAIPDKPLGEPELAQAAAASERIAFLREAIAICEEKE